MVPAAAATAVGRGGARSISPGDYPTRVGGVSSKAGPVSRRPWGSIWVFPVPVPRAAWQFFYYVIFLFSYSCRFRFPVCCWTKNLWFSLISIGCHLHSLNWFYCYVLKGQEGRGDTKQINEEVLKTELLLKI